MIDFVNTPFYDGQNGAEIKHRFNQMWSLWLLALEQAQGPQGWAPLPTLEQDGPTRVVMAVKSWVAGQGLAPTDIGYVGLTGLVATKAEAVNIRGGSGREVELRRDATYIQWRYVGEPVWVNLVPVSELKGDTGASIEMQVSTTHIQWRVQGSPIWIDLIALAYLKGADGEDGTDGQDGVDGTNAWTQVVANVPDGVRVVQQIVGWTGGTGVEPPVGDYIGPDGPTSDISEATDVRGAAGAGNGDVVGPAESNTGRIAQFADDSGKLLQSGPFLTAFATAAQGALANTAVQPEEMDIALSSKADTNALNDVANDLEFKIGQKLNSSEVGVSVAPLVDGLVPALHLPSYVDDVLEFADRDEFPAVGESGKIYVAVNDGDDPSNPSQQWRWSGLTYVLIPASPGSTDNVPEGVLNLYFTVARVRSTVLAGLSLVTGTAITAADTVLSALGKLQKQISDLVTTVASKIGEAPIDGKGYLRKDGAWAEDTGGGLSTGDILDTMRPAPDGYLSANGAAHPESTVPDLAALLGDAWRGSHFPELVTATSNLTGGYTGAARNCMLNNGNNWCIHADSAAALYSTDNGVTWAASASPPSGAAKNNGMAFGNGRIVALHGTTNGYAYSDNFGQTWTNATLPGNGPQRLIYVGGSTWVVLASSNAIYYKSTDNGATWTTYSNGGSANDTGAHLVTAAGSILLSSAIGTTGPFRRGVEAGASGYTWVSQSNARFNAVKTIVQSSNGRIGICGVNGVYTSDDDGLTWTERLPAATSGSVTALYCDGNLWIAAGSSPAGHSSVWVSTDNGVTWEEKAVVLAHSHPYASSSAIFSMSEIFVFDGLYFMHNWTGIWYVSSDLQKWHLQSIIAPSGWQLLKFRATPTVIAGIMSGSGAFRRQTAGNLIKQALWVPNIANRAPSVSYIKT